MTDVVNHPDHYKSGGMEAIDVLEAFFADDPLGWQVGKYILRYKKKNGLEDLQKAEFFLKRLIAKLSPPGPEQWDSLFDIPAHVGQVTNSTGVRWKYYPNDVWLDLCGKWRWSGGDAVDNEERIRGPFTEILDG